MHRWFIITISFLFIFFLADCGGGGGGGGDSGEHHVSYEVSSYSTDPFDIAYLDVNGDSQTVSNVNVYNDWSYSFSATSGTLLSLTATMQGINNDTYWVIIYVDYVKVKELNQNMPGIPATIEYTIP
jgi:hypothetical protein